MDITLTPASESHIADMAVLWAEAFPEKPAERRSREIREGFTFGDLTDCWVVEMNGRMAGALRTYRLHLNLWGRRVPTMGLAGVAVAPDFRRRGIGRRMCIDALEIARKRGDVLCALYPFRTSFYRELGFVLAGALHRYRFHAPDLPIYPGWDRVARVPDGSYTHAREIYDRVGARTNGFLVRTERMWGFLNRPGTYVYLHSDERGRPTGYVVVRGRGGPPERSRLRVVELVAEDRSAYLGLLGWLSVQRDQWGTIVYDAFAGEDFHQRLAHPRTEGTGAPRGLWFHSAQILRGPMLRILDLRAVMEANPGAPRVEGDPELLVNGECLQVRDLQLPENQGRWKGGQPGEHALDPSQGPIHSIADVTSLYLRGTLPGQPLPPEGWSPNLGLTGLRFLDEF